MQVDKLGYIVKISRKAYVNGFLRCLVGHLPIQNIFNKKKIHFFMTFVDTVWYT